LIPFGTPLVLVAAGPAGLAEARHVLARIGYDDVRGYLEGGFDAWARAGLPVASTPRMSVDELRAQLAAGGADAPLVLDVRHDTEWRDGHIPGARHMAAGRVPWEALDLPHDRVIAVHCLTGDRSTAAAAVLARRGYENVVLVDGGYAAWSEAGYPVEH
jgi:hydroxyacylglutathione hydrolase